MVPGQRVEQHRNVIEVAKTQGAALVAYTGITNSDSLDILLAEDHQATEAILVESGVPYALLRNDLYLDLYVGQIPMAVQNGAIVGSAGTGRLSAALRSEYAEATALLLQDDSTGTYELGGDQAFSLSEVAEAIAAATGTAVAYRDLPTDTYEQLLLGAGMPAPLAHVMADSHRAIANNALVTHSGDLSRLLGRPATTMPDAIRAAASR
jgi:NAD(P)H dehydrogenase (quinone)